MKVTVSAAELAALDSAVSRLVVAAEIRRDTASPLDAASLRSDLARTIADIDTLLGLSSPDQPRQTGSGDA